MNLCHEAVLRVLNLALGLDLRPPKVFSKGKPSATSEGLAEGLTEEIPRGAFNLALQFSPRAQIDYSRDRPRAQIHLATPEAFPQIVILSKFPNSRGIKKEWVLVLVHDHYL